MENTIRALNVLSAVIMLTVGVYIEATLWSLLSPVVQGVIEIALWLYLFSQVDLFLTGNRNKPGRKWRL